MATQSIVVSEPVQQQPSQWELIANETLKFFTQYWFIVALIIAFLIIVGLIYYILRKLEERKLTLFEKDYMKAVNMALNQYDKKRKTPNSFVTYAVSGVVAGFLGLTLIVVFQFLGFLASWLVIPLVLLLGFAIDYLYKPFQRGDKIKIRFLEDDKFKEQEIGRYVGSFFGNDGYFYLLIAKGRKNILWSNKFVLKIPQNYEFLVKYEKIKNGEVEIIRENAESREASKKFIQKIISWNDDSITINYCKSIEKEECFYYPVFHNYENQILDFGLKYYQSDRRGAFMSSHYQQTQDYAEAQSQAIKINPYGRFKNFVGEDFIEKPVRKKNQVDELD